MLIDTHTHTHHSFDGRARARQMAERAREMGLGYMAFTDHYDADYTHIEAYSYVQQLDMTGYIADVEALKSEFPFLALGLECGYSELAEMDYVKNVPMERFDYILNSVHTVDDLDAYNAEYFEKFDKHEAFKRYLIKVLASIDAKYFYNTISHIGFVRKNSPYADFSMSLSDYGDIIDEIFKKIIEKGKSVEVNTNIRSRDFMPTRELLKRYYDLGGRSITFASDAHVTERICEMFSEASCMVKGLGFEHWTVYRAREPIFIPID